MITSKDIGTQMVDARTGRTVTILAHDVWKGGQVVCVNDPATLNPMNIPGIENYWVDARHLVLKGDK